MKPRGWTRLTMVTVVAALILTPLASPAQTPDKTVTVHWSVKAFSMSNLAKFKIDLDAMVAKGFVPAAISRKGDDLWVMWLKNCPFYTSHTWNLAWFQTPRDGMKTKMGAKLIPVGITAAKDGKTMVMFSRMPTVKVKDWRMETVAAERNAVHTSIRKHQKDGYVPMGIDMAQKKVRLLYLKVKDWQFKAWKLDSAQENLLEIGINNHLRAGWVPVGLIFAKSIYVLYVR